MCVCVCVIADFSSCISSTRMKQSTQARYFPSSSLISSHVLMGNRVLFNTFLFVFQESYVWKMYQERCWEFFPAGDCFRKQYEDQLN